MNKLLAAALLSLAALNLRANSDIEKHDRNMLVENAVVTNGVKWIDGRYLPLEGKAFEEVSLYYDRLPKCMTTNINAGVRSMRHHTSGMLFRFATDSTRLTVKWVPLNKTLSMYHMPSTGMSGIDVYRYDKAKRGWFYVKTGGIRERSKGGQISIPWTPGDDCIINLPLYNGIKEFSLGIDEKANVYKPRKRRSGIENPVVFYGTSITHGGCASRPGMGFVNIVGRKCDVPVVGLGFSGSGVMEYELSGIIAKINASLYVIDTPWNMNTIPGNPRSIQSNYEPFLRNLRALKPDIPILLVEPCDVYLGSGENASLITEKRKLIKGIYLKLISEGWKGLHYLPNTSLLGDDFEGTVDGVHLNDLGMMRMADGLTKAVSEILKLKR